LRPKDLEIIGSVVALFPHQRDRSRDLTVDHLSLARNQVGVDQVTLVGTPSRVEHPERRLTLHEHRFVTIGVPELTIECIGGMHIVHPHYPDFSPVAFVPVSVEQHQRPVGRLLDLPEVILELEVEQIWKSGTSIVEFRHLLVPVLLREVIVRDVAITLFVQGYSERVLFRLCWVHLHLEDLPEGVVTVVRVCDRHFLEGQIENDDHNDHHQQNKSSRHGENNTVNDVCSVNVKKD
jgi:hypothetical protein